MVKYLRIALFFALLTCMKIDATIESWIAHHSAALEQSVFLLGDNHQSNDRAKGEEQLLQLLQILSNRELGEHGFYILVEEPCALALAQNLKPNILFNIKKEVLQNKFKKTGVENIEIRHIANECYSILVNPKAYRAVSKTTFADLFYEYYQNFKILFDFKDNIQSDSLRQIFQESLENAQTAAKELLTTLTGSDLDLKQTVLSTSAALYCHNEEDTRNTLANCVYNSFKELFELNLFKRILELQAAKRIIVISGLAHTEQLSSFLQDSHWQQISNTENLTEDFFDSTSGPTPFCNYILSCLN